VLVTESAEEFDRFHDDFSNELKPRGPVEGHLVDGMAGDVWEIRRLNRVKTGIINANVRPALNALLGDGDPSQWKSRLNPIVDRWCSDRDKREILKSIEQIKLDESAIEAAAVRSAVRDLEKIDRLIASQELRLGKALCLLAALRGDLGPQLHAKVERIINGKVLALDDASKKPPSATA
jgi:hypothetical protein